MILETERLLLRELAQDDFDALYAVLADPDISVHYPYTFDETRVRNWISRNRERYRKDGFGLWAVVLKETGEMIGDCGITMQSIHGQLLPEIGYHIRKDRQRRGYATEAAAACIRYAFEHYNFPAVYSYMKYTNIPSRKTALKNGMIFMEEYPDAENEITCVYGITIAQWNRTREMHPGIDYTSQKAMCRKTGCETICKEELSHGKTHSAVYRHPQRCYCLLQHS